MAKDKRKMIRNEAASVNRGTGEVLFGLCSGPDRLPFVRLIHANTRRALALKHRTAPPRGEAVWVEGVGKWRERG
ncbi:MAG: hypothetical protein CMJ83_00385 [Planctomycetes bacterium]|nr:hypothetical protein [Planctomycetota bacterium]